MDIIKRMLSFLELHYRKASLFKTFCARLLGTEEFYGFYIISGSLARDRHLYSKETIGMEIQLVLLSLRGQRPGLTHLVLIL